MIMIVPGFMWVLGISMGIWLQLASFCNAYVLSFTEPGQYIVNRSQIQGNTFDVEMWSGGGGGIGYFGSYSYMCGGQGGSYVKGTVLIDTSTNIVITIGSGGAINRTGESTQMIAGKTNITIYGGDACLSYGTLINTTQKVFVKNVLSYVNMTGYGGTSGYIYNYGAPPVFGGSAPFGGQGARRDYNVYAYAERPGGGGLLNGADGMVIITFYPTNTSNVTTGSDSNTNNCMCNGSTTIINNITNVTINNIIVQCPNETTIIPTITTYPTNDTDQLLYQHTNTFNKYWRNPSGNFGLLFFDSSTFGMDISQILKIDPCTVTTSTSLFRKYVNDNIKCTGIFCVNGSFKCVRESLTGNNSMDCYNVDHVIDVDGPEYGKNNQCKLIIANLVMVWGKWNQENGRMMGGDYVSAIAEKTTVLSVERITLVRRYLEQCGCKE